MKSKTSSNHIETSMLSTNNASIQENTSNRANIVQSSNPQQQDKAKPISIASAIFTMFIGIVGAGCLALPYAIRQAGFVIGISLIIAAPILSYFTLDLLVIACEYLPNNLTPSYQALTQKALGNKAKRALEYLMLLMYFGALAGYVVAWSGLIDLVWQELGFTKYIKSVYVYNGAVLGISYGITLPLSLLRNLSALQYTSCFGAICATYLSIVVFTDYLILCNNTDVTNHYPNGTCLSNEEKQDLGGKVLFPFTGFISGYQGFLTAFPLIVFSYTGHMYILPVYVRLKNKSLKRIRIVFKLGNLFIFLCYILIACFGFFLFLDDVCGNVLLNDFKRKNDIIIASCGVAISCICTSPLHTYNFRRTLAVILWNETPEQLSLIKHFLIAVVFVSLNVVVGLYIKSITVVFGWLGATMYPFMGYILPAIFFCKMVPVEKYIIRKFIAILQAVIMAIICCAAFIWSFWQPGSDDYCDNAYTIG
eukprot:48398_1